MSQEREEEDLDTAAVFDPRRVNVTKLYKHWQMRADTLLGALLSAAQKSTDPEVRGFACELFQAKAVICHLEEGDV